jgi:hypothetical protein
VTLGAVLNAIREQSAFYFSWNFRGDFLLARNAAYRLIEASVLPEDTLRAFEDEVKPGSSLALDDLAGFMANLNPLQTDRLVSTSHLMEPLLDLELRNVRLYGTLQPDQRASLSTPEGLRFEDLSAEQRRTVVSHACLRHPWLDRSDLSSAVLRSMPRKLSTGDDAVSLIVEYHFPDSPSDRDILFTAPLQMRLGPH